MIQHIDEVLDRAVSTDSTPIARYDIRDVNGNLLFARVAMELVNKVNQEGTPLNKPLLDEFLAASGETAGDGTAYMLDQPGYVLADGAVTRVRVHTASETNPTLNISGTGAKPLINAQGRPMQKLQPGVWYTAIYSAALDSYVVQGVGGNIATGTYVGTGTSGAENPNVLTFDFEPQFVFISKSSQLDDNYFYISNMTVAWFMRSTAYSVACRPFYDPIDSEYLLTEWDGTTLEWYSGIGTMLQMNSSGVTYQWLAIG